jgi:hypothetical protein
VRSTLNRLNSCQTAHTQSDAITRTLDYAHNQAHAICITWNVSNIDAKLAVSDFSDSTNASNSHACAREHEIVHITNTSTQSSRSQQTTPITPSTWPWQLRWSPWPTGMRGMSWQLYRVRSPTHTHAGKHTCTHTRTHWRTLTHARVRWLAARLGRREPCVYSCDSRTTRHARAHAHTHAHVPTATRSWCRRQVCCRAPRRVPSERLSPVRDTDASDDTRSQTERIVPLNLIARRRPASGFAVSSAVRAPPSTPLCAQRVPIVRITSTYNVRIKHAQSQHTCVPLAASTAFRRFDSAFDDGAGDDDSTCRYRNADQGDTQRTRNTLTNTHTHTHLCTHQRCSRCGCCRRVRFDDSRCRQ